MPECGNCDSWVSHAYARVAKTNENGNPIACQQCGHYSNCLVGVKKEDYETKNAYNALQERR